MRGAAAVVAHGTNTINGKGVQRNMRIQINFEVTCMLGDIWRLRWYAFVASASSGRRSE